MPAETPKRTVLDTVKQYGGRLFGFIRDRVRTEEDAEDILQDVWYQLSRVVDLDQISSLSGWLYEVARNRITDRYRRTRETVFTDAAREERMTTPTYHWMTCCWPILSRPMIRRFAT